MRYTWRENMTSEKKKLTSKYHWNEKGVTAESIHANEAETILQNNQLSFPRLKEKINTSDIMRAE